MSDIVLPALGVGFAAFCLWFAVRLVNRRWRPGRRFWIVAPLLLLLGYPLSFGLAVWLSSHEWLTDRHQALSERFFAPIVWVYENCPAPIPDAIDWYAHLWMH